MTRHGGARPEPPPERRYPVTVQLTTREMAALVGDCTRPASPVAICVTSADDENYRVNLAGAALRQFLDAVQQQRP